MKKFKGSPDLLTSQAGINTLLGQSPEAHNYLHQLLRYAVMYTNDTTNHEYSIEILRCAKAITLARRAERKAAKQALRIPGKPKRPRKVLLGTSGLVEFDDD